MELANERMVWVVLVVVLGIGYGVGLWYNRRLGRAVYRWLHQGLQRAFPGGQMKSGWLGSASTGARWSVRPGQGPFRALEVAFLLQTRELLPLWLVNRLRRRGDEIVVRAVLRSGVPVEWEIGPAMRKGPPGFTRVAGLPLPAGWVAWARPADASSRLDWTPFLRAYGHALRGLSLRRATPHLIVRLDLAALRATPAHAWLQALQRVWPSGT